MNMSQQSQIKDTDDKATLRARITELERENGLLKQTQGAHTEVNEGPLVTRMEAAPELVSLQHLCKTAPIGLCCLDEKLRFVFVNEWLAAINGLSVEEHLGRTISEVLPDVAAGVEAQLRRVIETGESIVGGIIKAETPAASGVKQHYQHNSYAIRSADGTIVGLNCVVQEITAHKQAEEAMHESEERIRLLLEGAFEGIIISEQGKIIEANQAFANMFGYLLDEVIGLSPVELTTPESALKIEERITLGDERPYEFVGLKRDGTPFDVEVVGKNCSYRGRDARITAIRDITERKKAEEAVAISEARFRGLLEAGPDGVVIVDNEGIIQLANARTEEMFGFASGELLGKPIEVFVPERMRATHLLTRTSYLTSPQASQMGVDLEVIGQRKDGSEFPTDVSLSPLETDEGFFVMGIIRDITERKKAEMDLQNSERRFRLVFEAAPSGMVIVDVDGKVLRSNSAMLNMLGYSEEEFRSMDVSQYTPANDIAEGKRLFVELREGKRDRFQLEKRYIRKDGQILWGNLAFSSVRNAQGEVQYLIASIRDITERREIEEDLKRSQFAVEHCSNSVYWVREDGRISYANEAACQSLGYSLDELVSMSVYQIDPDFPEDAWPKHWQEMRLSKHLTFEANHQRKDGRVFPVEITTSFLEYKSEEFIWAFVTDISERRRANAENARLMMAIEQAQEAIVITDDKGIIEYINPAFERITGYKKTEMLGQNPNLVSSGLHDARFYKEMWGTLMCGETWSGELINKRKNGTLFTEESTITPIRDDTGKTVNYIAVKHDITERKQAEGKSKQLQADLAHLSRLGSMGEMASGLAHELNQPLTVITNYARGCIRRLKSKAISEEELESILDRIAIQAQRSSSIIRGLGNLVRKNSTLPTTDTDINQTIIDVIELAKAEAAQHFVKAKFELEPNLPSVKADQTQLQQVILNLVQNGCEASEDLPLQYRVVTLRAKQSGESQIEITVSDNGVGIPKALSDQLFEPFFTTKTRGIGMGLAISRSIVESHGGRLWATPNQDKGTTFHFTLPIVRGGEDDEK